MSNIPSEFLFVSLKVVINEPPIIITAIGFCKNKN